MEGDCDLVLFLPLYISFQSTPSAWRETSVNAGYLQQVSYFNPLPPHGGRPTYIRRVHKNKEFQSTPSAWRETNLMWCTQMENIFQSTPSAWRETLSSVSARISKVFQSTPSAWRETRTSTAFVFSYSISIHSLRMEGDRNIEQQERESKLFQSTPSAWRETSFNVPPSLCIRISIHSLRMEGDLIRSALLVIGFEFQSTPSAWRETESVRTMGSMVFYFNPLPPHGGRHCKTRLSGSTHRFQSTPSAWRETRYVLTWFQEQLFQSTPSAWRETAKLHRKAFFISPILVQSCKKGCKRLHSAPEKMVFFEKREKNLVRNLQHLSVRL